MICVLLNLFRCALQPRMWSLMVNILWGLEKNMRVEYLTFNYGTPLLFVSWLQRAANGSLRVWSSGSEQGTGWRGHRRRDVGLPGAASLLLTTTLLGARGLCATRRPQLSQGRVSILDARAHSLRVQLTWGTSKCLKTGLCFCDPQTTWSEKSKVKNIVHIHHMFTKEEKYTHLCLLTQA